MAMIGTYALHWAHPLTLIASGFGWLILFGFSFGIGLAGAGWRGAALMTLTLPAAYISESYFMINISSCAYWLCL
jgi:hypothetical protein